MIRKAAILALIVTIVFAVASCSKDSTGPKEKEKPTVSITNAWDAAKEGGIVRDGIVDITVEAYDDAGIARVELVVNNRYIAVDATEPYTLEWDMSSLAGGSTNSIYVQAVDRNGNTEKTDTVTVVKGASAAPVATMTSPSDVASIQQGVALTLSGTASDADEGDLSDSRITWRSNLQGNLGQGKSFDNRGLVIGEHVITMTATDSNGMIDTATATVTVTGNNNTYATIEAGSYYIAEPLFNKSTVILTKAIYVSKTEMTVQEFFEMRAIADGDATAARKWADKRNKKLFDVGKNEGLYLPLFDYSGSKNDPIVTAYSNYPACFITYIEAIVACNSMSDRDGFERAYIYLDKNDDPVDDFGTKMKGLRFDDNASGWRLPTEAEWEVAARAGLTGTKFPWGDSGPGGLCNSMSDPTPPNALDLFNSRGICPVDSYKPNRYGLYNIVGNVAEMCTDMFVGTPPSGIDPLAVLEETNPLYLAKGGAWYEFGANMQIAMRHLTIPFSEKEKASYGSGFGLRVVRNAD